MNFISASRRCFSGRARIRSRTGLTNTQSRQDLEEQIRKLQMLQLQNQQLQSRPGFLQTIKEGVLHGFGWAFAQRIVDSIFGPRTLQFFQQPDNNLGNTSSTESNSLNDEQGWSWGAEDFFEDE